MSHLSAGTLLLLGVKSIYNTEAISRQSSGLKQWHAEQTYLNCECQHLGSNCPSQRFSEVAHMQCLAYARQEAPAEL